MKILLITDHHSLHGGAEHYFFNLKQRLKDHPTSRVYSLGFGPTEIEGDDYYILKAASSNIAKLCWRYLPHPGIASTLKKRIKQFNPDVIHLHSLKQYPHAVLSAIQAYPVIQTMHDFSFICPTGQNIHKDLTPCATGLRASCLLQHHVKFNPLIYIALLPPFYALRRRLKKIVKQWLAPSPVLADYLSRHGFTPARYLPLFKPNTQQPAFDRIKPMHFLYAGALGAHKGTQLLLDEFALACQINPALHLSIAGDGPEQQTMQARVTALKLEHNVTFLGWQTDLTPHYQAALALIFPSIGLESFGLVMSEAMNHSRPIIGVNRGTTAWLVEDEHTGLLFDPLKKGELAQKILRLAQDNALAMRLGQAGQLKIEKMMDNQTTFESLLDSYQSLLNEKMNEKKGRL